MAMCESMMWRCISIPGRGMTTSRNPTSCSRASSHNVSRSVTVYVPVDAVVSERIKGERGTTATVSLSAAKKARGLTVTTTPVATSLAVMLGEPNTLSAKKVLLAAPK